MFDKIRYVLLDVLDGVLETLELVWVDLKHVLDTPHSLGELLGHAVLPAVVVIVALLTCDVANADDRVLVHTVSEHSTAGPHVERNWGVGIELQAGQQSACDQYVVGTYRNSNGDASTYATCGWVLATAGPVELHGQLGGVTGYDDVTALAGLNARLDVPGPVDPDVFVAPLRERDGGVGGVALLSLTTAF